MSDDWKERFRKKFVKYDPSPIANEILISGIYLTDIEEFIQLEIRKAKEEGAREEREKITKEVTKGHEDLHALIIDKPGYDAYSDDYKHGILRGFTLVGRYLDSLK